MKSLLFLVIAALIVGFVIFAVSFWIFRLDLVMSSSFGIAGGLGGLIVDYFRPYLKKHKNN